MSKFTDMADTSHRLSLTAMEEASRYGQRTADIDHMLLALTVNEQIAGHVLRGLGITLEAAREAVEHQHAAQLASLGVTATTLEPGPIVFHETGGYEWGDRSLTVIKRASERGKRGDAAAILRELVAEPSGLIVEILSRLNSSPEAVLVALDEVEFIPTHSPGRTRDGALTRSAETFVPAPLSEVWELVADPSRLSEWDQNLGGVAATGTLAGVRPGDRWEGWAPTERPDGKPLSIRPELRRQTVELGACTPESLVEWRVTYPDAELANTRVTRIELALAAGGTHLTVTYGWERHADRRPRPLLRLIMRSSRRSVPQSAACSGSDRTGRERARSAPGRIRTCDQRITRPQFRPSQTTARGRRADCARVKRWRHADCDDDR